MRMRQLCFFLLWAISLPVLAQRSDTTAATAPRLMLKVAMGELLGPQYSKISLSAALRIKPKQYLEAGGGKLFDQGFGRQRVEWHNFSGYTVEASYRLFSKPLRRPGIPTGTVWWVSGGPVYEQLKGQLDGDFSREEGGYYQRFRYDVKDQRAGIKLSAGAFWMLGKHVLLEWGFGFFAFDRKLEYSELPADAQFVRNGSRHWHYNHNGSHHRFDARGSMIVRIGWMFY